MLAAPGNLGSSENNLIGKQNFSCASIVFGCYKKALKPQWFWGFIFSEKREFISNMLVTGKRYAKAGTQPQEPRPS